MSGHLAATVAGYGLLLAVAALWRAATGRGPTPTLLAAVVFLEGVLVVAAVLEVVRLLGGRHAAEPATHAGYLVASVVVLPLALGQRSPRNTPWDATIVGAGLLAAAVVALRLWVTGG